MNNLEESIQHLLFSSSLGPIGKNLNVPTIKAVFGEFPIDAWKQYPLEVPKEGCKGSITGRCFHAFGLAVKEPVWNTDRVIKLPVYPAMLFKVTERDSDSEFLNALIQGWSLFHVFDEVPILAIATGVAGCYCDSREFQTISVLPIWQDSVGRILELNWAEGPLEDCISPEWYLRSTPLLGLGKAIEEAKKICRQEPPWDNLSFFIYAIPPFLGSLLRGKRVRCNLWYGWKYNQYFTWKEDLNLIFSNVLEAFYGK